MLSGVRVAQSADCCVAFEDRCLSLDPLILAIALRCLRFTASDYPVGSFKPLEMEPQICKLLVT